MSLKNEAALTPARVQRGEERLGNKSKLGPSPGEVKIGPPREPGLRGDERYLTAASEARAMFKAGALLPSLVEALRPWNRDRCRPPLSEEDLLICIDASWHAVFHPTPRWTPAPRVTILPLKPEVAHAAA